MASLGLRLVRALARGLAAQEIPGQVQRLARRLPVARAAAVAAWLGGAARAVAVPLA